MQSKKNIRTNRKYKSIKRNNSKRRKKLKGGAKPCRNGLGICIDGGNANFEKCYYGLMNDEYNRQCNEDGSTGPKVCCILNQI